MMLDSNKLADRIKAILEENKMLKEQLESADAVSREAHYDAIANRITDMEERGFVSVVRCKCCRQYIPHDLTDDYGWCCEFKTLINEDDFCSRGERETNDRHNQTV